jgi:hypothetical protein
MERPFRSVSDSESSPTEAQTVPKPSDIADDHSIRKAAKKRLEMARERFLSAAIAFCDGSISAGQLRAARELLREKELRLTQIEAGKEFPLIEEPLPESPPAKLELVDTRPVQKREEPKDDWSIPEGTSPGLTLKLTELNIKFERLQEDFKRGHINPSQFEAIRRHYQGQREIALRMGETHPQSNRWQVVLEEGKTTFLMQLNEATCRCVGIYEINSRDRIFVQGEMPDSAEDAMALLSTFGNAEPDSASGRMYSTQTETGLSLLLIPGRFTVCLVVFSQAPPDWQVRALREVHRHFETANRPALEHGKRSSLIFPNLRRFIRI